MELRPDSYFGQVYLCDSETHRPNVYIKTNPKGENYFNLEKLDRLRKLLHKIQNEKDPLVLPMRELWDECHEQGIFGDYDTFKKYFKAMTAGKKPVIKPLNYASVGKRKERAVERDTFVLLPSSIVPLSTTFQSKNMTEGSAVFHTIKTDKS